MLQIILDYLVDSSFQAVNGIFDLAFNANDNWTGYSRYYLPTEKTEDYNVMIDRKNILEKLI